MTKDCASVGEFGLIDRIASGATQRQATTLTGIGDDCAVLGTSEGMVKVVTTDLLLEGIHFDLTYCPLRHLGYKSVAVNVSDVCAMNAWPRQITLSLGVSGKFGLAAIDEFVGGVHSCCERYGVDLVGGDTSSSLTGMCVSVTAVGERERSKLSPRSGARPGDILCVSGDLGGAYAGLLVLEREKRAWQGNKAAQPALKGYDYVLSRQLKPEPRLDVVEFLEKIGVVPTSMIDVSDGLSSEALHLCERSGVGCRLYEEKIPVAAETRAALEEMNIHPSTAALNGGEDYELLLSISPSDYSKFTTAPGPEIYAVGYVTEASQGSALITTSGQEVRLTAMGFEGFRD